MSQIVLLIAVNAYDRCLLTTVNDQSYIGVMSYPPRPIKRALLYPLTLSVFAGNRRMDIKIPGAT